MAWFWSSREKKDDDDDESYASDEESYTSGDEEHDEQDLEDADADQLEDDEDDEEGGVLVEETAIATESTTPEESKAAAAAALQKKKAVTAAYAAEFFNDSSNNLDDLEDDTEQQHQQRFEAHIPAQVVPAAGNRARAPSALTVGDDDDLHAAHDDDDDEDGLSRGESNTSVMSLASVDHLLDDSSARTEDDDDDAPAHSVAAQRSLLVLAAEHDRVDILNSILSPANAAQQDVLLHGGLPPLHVAVVYGATHSATCLLRLGADPSLRPNVATLRATQDPQAPLTVPPQIDGRTAWELAFGSGSHGRLPKTLSKPQQALLHAFTAEALRCLGSDEGVRLRQLLAAGMPGGDTPVMGEQSLYDWAVELGAPACEQVLRPSQVHGSRVEKDKGTATIPAQVSHPSSSSPLANAKTAVLDRPSTTESAVQLLRQLEELDALAKALSTCLDSLAEEVSVSHGLLLMGGGASALASHVRSLKAQKNTKGEALDRHAQALEQTQEELDYWVQQTGARGAAIAAADAPLSQSPRSSLGSRPSSSCSSPHDEKEHCVSLHGRIAATHENIRKFRVSIAELSEENDRNLQEVERRGLVGGINLVRNLKDEIRELEFSLEEVQTADAVFRLKIEKIQALGATTSNTIGAAGEEGSVAGTVVHTNGDDSVELANENFVHVDETPLEGAGNGNGLKASQKIATGQSTALTLHEGPGRPGYFSISLWQMLMRIMGLRDEPPPPPPRRSKSSYSSQPAMIV
jgi:hypothetical protein